LQDLFYRLSDESVYRRFLAFKRAHPHEEMQRLVDLDYEQNMALIASLSETEPEQIIAMLVMTSIPLPASRTSRLSSVTSGKGTGSALS
jgi:hypothetical protein